MLIDLMPRIIAQPTEPYPGVDVLRRCLELASAVRSAGGTVVFVRVERPGVEAQSATTPGRGAASDAPSRSGRSGSELAPECAPEPGDVQIVKQTWGAFQNTGLDAELRARGIGTVVLGGLATNFGVESTGRIADEHGYATVFVTDAMAGLHAHAHTFAVEYVFPKLGTVCTTAELLAALG